MTTKKLTALEKYRQKMEEKKNQEANKNKGKQATPTSKKTSVSKTSSKKPSTKKPTTKQTSVSKGKETVKKEAKKGLSSSALIEKLKGKLASLGTGGGGSRFNFVKWKKGKNTFRIVEATSGPFILFYKRHRGGQGSNFRAPLALDWLTSEEEQDTLEAMLERDAISKADLELVDKHGDPFNILIDGLRATGNIKKYNEAGIGQKRSLMTVFYEGEFAVLDMGIKFGKQVIDILEENPDMIKWDSGLEFVIKATGDGLDREYSFPVSMKLVGELKFEVEDQEEIVTPNLYDVLANNLMGYMDKTQFLFKHYQKLVDLAGMDISDFGISEEDLSESFNYGANRKDEEGEEE